MATLTEVVEIIIKGTVPTTGSGAKNIFNVFHYRWVTGTVLPASGVLSSFLSGVWANIAAALSIDYTGVESDARRLDDANEQYVVGTVPASGGVALPRLGVDLAVAWLLRTNTRGKSFRGSKHFAGIPTAYVTKDELNSTGSTAWNAVATYLTANIGPGGSTYAPCVVSKTLSQLKTNPTTIIGADITAALLNKTIGTMRRRREKTVR